MRSVVFALSALSIVASGLAQAQLNVAEVSLLVLENQQAGVQTGWTMSVEIEGAGITSAAITPPGKDAITVPGGTTHRELESDAFASFSALQQEFPPSNGQEKYVITLNGSTELTLDFVPVPADDFARLTFPTDGASTLDTSPTFTMTNACTNCVGQNVWLQDLSASGPEREHLDFGPPFPSAVELSTLRPTISQLPLDDYELCIGAASGAIEYGFSSGGQTFDYTHAALAEDCIEFRVVPQPDVTEASIQIISSLFPDDVSWFFVVTVTGGDLLDASVTSPSGATLDLISLQPGEFIVFDGGFESLGALQASYPPNSSGGYSIALNGGVSTAELDFDPVVPDGSPVITSPAPDAMVGPRPSFTFTNGCTNCEQILAEITDLSSAGSRVLLQASFGQPFPTKIVYPDFDPNLGSLGEIEELPEGHYRFLLNTENVDTSVESFVPTDDFDLHTGAVRNDSIMFEVPEPRAGALAGAALVTLAALGRRRIGE